MKLTKREVDSLICPSGRKDMLVFADNLAGFGCRVTADGAKVFLFQYRAAGGQVRRMRLGRYGDITPAQARTLALQFRMKVARGEDPAGERKTVAVEAITFAGLASRWSSQGLKDRRESYRGEADRALRVNFQRLSQVSARDIAQADAQDVLDRIAADRGAPMARRSQAYARAMYGWAVKRGLVTANPFAAATVEGREVSRDRALSDGELGEVWRAAGGLSWPFGPFLRFLLLTLQREAEVAGLRWHELAGDSTTWTIPATRTKNGKPHQVHLSAPARAILAAIPRPPDRELVFTTTGDTPVSGFSRAKARLDLAIAAEQAATAAKGRKKPTAMPAWRLHDLRRTGVTALARLGVRWEVADRVLNHQTGAIQGVAAVYQRHEFLEERRRAMDVWASHVLAAGEAAAMPNNVHAIGEAEPRG